MPEAVIVAAARSPIGRAGKGTLTEMRPDDLILGCTAPAGESGFNLGRPVAVLAGLDHLPGVTVNRYRHIAMGQTAENVAQVLGMSRREQDEFGVRSQNPTEQRVAEGFWAREITPVTLPDGSTVRADDSPRAGVTFDAVSQLKPVFRPDSTVTADNACPLNDAAVAVVIMSDTRAKELGLTSLADKQFGIDSMCVGAG
jgi:acetyl-CoA acetyltransferase